MSSAEQATGMNASAASASPPARKGSRRWLFVLLTGILVVVAAGFVAFAIHYRNSHNTAGSLGTSMRASGIPIDISTPLANFMGIDALPSKAAPDFTLTDQHGKIMSLSSFRGHPVVLEFMDPHCTDICPLVSQEFVDAYHDLGRAGRSVVFVAVNVNRYALTVTDVATFSSAHGLDAIPTWHFFTGSYPTLAAIWRQYGIAVISRGPTKDTIHSSIIYFIGPNGRERFLASPQDEHTKSGKAYLPLNQLAEWGKGIALVSKNLLPRR